MERFAYDPWGARRNPDNWAEKDSRSSWLVNRGYTWHEHLDAFGIINMNGRVYDPATAQFFSPDPFIQAPDNWNNFNRYAYCMNNPVMYTDPSGYNYLKFGCSQEELDRIKSFKGSASMLGDNLETRSTFSHWGVTHNFSNSYYYAGNGMYNNMYGHNVSFGEVYNNCVVPNASVTWEGVSAVNVFNSVSNGYDIYEVNAFGRNTYVAAIGALGEMYRSSDGAVGFSGMFVGALIGVGIEGKDWTSTILTSASNTAIALGWLNSGHNFIEWQYLKEARLDRTRAGNFSQPIQHSLRGIKTAGRSLGYLGIGISMLDIAYNGPNLSNSLDLVMGGLAFTGWGAPIAAGYFVLNIGWQIFSDGHKTIGESIQQNLNGNLSEVRITKL